MSTKVFSAEAKSNFKMGAEAKAKTLAMQRCKAAGYKQVASPQVERESEKDGVWTVVASVLGTKPGS